MSVQLSSRANPPRNVDANGFRHVAANSLLDFVADQIVEAIGNGRFLPGQGLYEIEVTKQFSISRVPVGEALLVLKSQEVLRFSPRCGTYVIDLDENRACEFYETPTALEARCSQRAAPVLRDDPRALGEVLVSHVTALQEACRSRIKLEINRADLAFHSAVYDFAGSPLLLTLCNAMSRHVMILFGLETYGHSDLVGIVEEHVQLRRVLLEETAASIADGVARRVIGPFDSKMIAERTQETAFGRQQ